MIDPVEALIAEMARDADLNALVDGQIAERHKFGDGWPISSNAIQVQLADGEPDVYCQWQRPRIEVRCYGTTRPQAMAVYGALVTFSRKTHREVVETSQGKALVYYFLMDSGPSLLVEEDTGIDFVLVYAKLAVAEQDV